YWLTSCFAEDDTNTISTNIGFLIEPSVDYNVRLLVMVNSMPDRFEERQMIRTSWALPDLYDERNTKVLFLIGKPTSLEIEELLAIEEGRFHDIVVADIREDYYSLSLKTYAMLYFKVHRVPSAKCLVKADSDNVLLIRNYERLCEETSTAFSELPEKVLLRWLHCHCHMLTIFIIRRNRASVVRYKPARRAISPKTSSGASSIVHHDLPSSDLVFTLLFLGGVP
ncbi:hypothetical protein OSTOST_08402, partial [Ostertagia ostertagi]